MDKRKDEAFDNLIAELRKKSFKGSPIDFNATEDNGLLSVFVNKVLQKILQPLTKLR